MEELKSLVIKARLGDLAAFGQIVRRFQDMAYGYAHSILGDFHLAEDVAQEAFIEAYCQLPNLRHPNAFPGWFRRIVFKHCDRIIRHKRLETVPLDVAVEMEANDSDPAHIVEQHEMQEKVLEAIQALPEHQRMVTTLFYINGYSQKEVAEFLEVPVTTVKKRLHDSRKRLEELITMAKETLKQNRPGAEFVRQLKEKLNGKIIELPDGCIQVFYDFVSEKQLQDWQVFLHKTAPPEIKIKEKGMAFGRLEPEDTDKQWDRDVRLKLVLDPDPKRKLEIEFDVTWGTNEPWSCAAWVLTRRDGYGSGIPFFEGVVTDFNQEWRQRRNDHTKDFKDGCVRADFLIRCDYDDKNKPGYLRWAAPAPARWDIPIANLYHMKVRRHKRKLCWEVNGQTIGETGLADEEFCLTERLVFCNYGKGTGAVFRNVVIRSGILDVDPSWPAAELSAAPSPEK